MQQQQPPAERSFYYWKSVFKLTDYEKATFQSLKATSVYLKFFDVDWDEVAGKPMPKAILHVADSSFFLNDTTELVPTIFITNECLYKMNLLQVNELGKKIKQLLDDLIQHYFLKIPIKEIQFDCDWSSATKEKYFALLELMKKKLGTDKLSATIRLHQIKYFAKTGIPPVDKGLLMCYNMGNLKNFATANSILDATEFKKYTANLGSYSLPLDVALPLFNWKVLFRNNQFKGLLQQLSNNRLLPSFCLQKGNRFELLKDTLLMGYDLRKGDIVRNEESKYDEILQVGSLLSNKLPAAKRRLILFHLDSVTLKKYSTDELENIYNSLH